MNQGQDQWKWCQTVQPTDNSLKFKQLPNSLAALFWTAHFFPLKKKMDTTDISKQYTKLNQVALRTALGLKP